MGKSLVMGFLTAGGKKVSLRVDHVKDDLTKDQVSAAMNAIIAKNIFTSKSGDLKLKDSAIVVVKEESKLAVN